MYCCALYYCSSQDIEKTISYICVLVSIVKIIKTLGGEMLLAIDLRSVKFLCTSQETNVSTIKEGAKKFPTVQTRKKFKVEIL